MVAGARSSLHGGVNQTLTPHDIAARIASVPHWYHRIEVAPGVFTPGITDSATYRPFIVPFEDWHGTRVLDLGTRDGYWAFEFEKLGAEVVAVDYMPLEGTGFAVAADLLGSKVEYVQANLYDLRPEVHGTFDLVLFLGLLYHLPDPLGAINRIRRLSRDRMVLETQSMDRAVLLADGSFASLDQLAPALKDLPLMQFYPGDSLNNDFTNYWAPNLACLKGMLVESNFTVARHEDHGSRVIVDARVADDPRKDHLMKAAYGEEAPGF